MTDLTDFQRRVHDPFVAKAKARISELQARVAEAEKALAKTVDALVEIGGGWRDEETPPCFCGGDSTAESLVRCTRIRNLIVAAGSLPSGAAAESGEACEHDWRDARNPIIESGEMCAKCGAMQAGNANSAAASGDGQPPGDFYPSDWAG